MLNGLLAVSNDVLYALYWTVCVICIVIIFLAALTTIIMILFQKSNSDGIQGITASSETFYGKNKGRSIESKLKKWTWICLAVIAVLSIVYYVVQVIAQYAL